MSCKCIYNPPPESIEGTVSKQGKLYTRLSRNLIFLHRPRIRRFIWWASKCAKFIQGRTVFPIHHIQNGICQFMLPR